MTFFDNEVHRVAAYCRVSTDSDDQANSLESQQKYFGEYIKRNPLWEIYDIYVDEGISGTNTSKRVAFNRMIDDAESGKFDLIITKEISRFARNTLDSIAYTRRLKEIGVGVIFMNDNINTLDSDGELRLTIMSSIAQDESRKTSERVKWGHRRRMEQGVVFGRDMLGYDVRGGKMYINEEGAETVRKIFYKYLEEGKGTNVIAKELREEGVKTSTYMKDWSYTVILRVLKNEKYCGDLVQQKTYTPDYLSHKKRKNDGKLEYVTIRNHHEPIISRERFEAVQREMERRRDLMNRENGFGNRYALSGKIRCGECGATYTRVQKTLTNGRVNVTWNCHTNRKYGREKALKNGDVEGCNNKLINDRDIQAILQAIVNDILADKTQLIDSVIKTISAVLESDCSKDNITYFEKAIEKNKSKKERLLDMCLNGDIETADYREMSEKLKTELADLEEKLKNEKIHQTVVENKENVLNEIKDYINKLATGEEWDEIFYRNLVDKIVVNKDRQIDVHLKLIPDKWTAKILCGQKEIEDYKSICDTGCTSEPISVNVPLSSGRGIVNL
jgi:DNA invertase Pin-like site-specific DNA recombinase